MGLTNISDNHHIHVSEVSSGGDCAYQSADVPLAVPLDLGDLLLVVLVLHPQVSSLHLVRLDHVAESLVRLLLGGLELGDLLQELHPLLVEEATRLLLGFQRECGAHLEKQGGERGRLLMRLGRISI